MYFFFLKLYNIFFNQRMRWLFLCFVGNRLTKLTKSDDLVIIFDQINTIIFKFSSIFEYIYIQMDREIRYD